MNPVDEDINSMATKCCTAAWTHQVSQSVKTAFTNSSTATAQMLRPIKVNFTTEQLQDSGGGILLAHTSNNLQQESMVSPVQQL